MFWNIDRLELLDVATMPTKDLTVPASLGLRDGQIVQVFQGEMFVHEVDPVRRVSTGRPQEFKVVNA